MKLLIIINKDEGVLGPSETFLHAHINGLPCEVVTLVGNPGFRCLDYVKKKYIPSRSIIPLGLRWILKQVGYTTSEQIDKKALINFINKNKINSVLAEYGPTAVTVMDACKEACIPLIAHFHGWDAHSHYLRQLHAEDYKKLFGTASAVIAVSNHMRNVLIDLGANPEKTYHNACGADIPKDLSAKPEVSKCRFAMVGRLTEKKAPFISLIAFSEVVKQYPECHLDIIGDGPLMDASNQVCQGLNITKNVTFHGAQPHSKVIELLKQVRCFIQHSVCAPSGDSEGTPVGVLEAMGMGLPVVSTNHAGIMDIIKTGQTGSLVDEYDINAMANEMLKYAKDPNHAKTIGDAARNKVLNNWTNEKSILNLWEIIDSVSKKQ